MQQARFQIPQGVVDRRNGHRTDAGASEVPIKRTIAHQMPGMLRQLWPQTTCLRCASMSFAVAMSAKEYPMPISPDAEVRTSTSVVSFHDSVPSASGVC